MTKGQNWLAGERYKNSKGEPHEIYLRIAARIKEARLSIGMSQKEASYNLGVARETLRSWENGLNRVPLHKVEDMMYLYAIADWRDILE